jgi:hypothetical protein
MRRLRADRGDNPAPGIQCHIENIVDGQRAIRQQTQFDAQWRSGIERSAVFGGRRFEAQ